MTRVFITGSADGLGQLAAKALVARDTRSYFTHATVREDKRLWKKFRERKVS
jgi:NAD(P)-dependent dehydrogenase (short-subunit alcohol dehydrogenase family)